MIWAKTQFDYDDAAVRPLYDPTVPAEDVRQ